MKIVLTKTGEPTYRVVEKWARTRRLSARETQVLHASLVGRSRKQIANEEGLSPGTVASHWRRIMRKTGCRSQRAVFAIVFSWVAERSDASPGDINAGHADAAAVVTPTSES
jgi:DNA-binding CsgD family transcriptional regulator